MHRIAIRNDFEQAKHHERELHGIDETDLPCDPRKRDERLVPKALHNPASARKSIGDDRNRGGE